MHILITGSRGMLGTDLTRMLSAAHEVVGCDLHNCNILDYDQFDQVVADAHPDVIIHAAAYTNVDQAETDHAAALQLNETGTQYVAMVAKPHRARLFYISTDYVFDGAKTTPYREDDPPCPLGVYGLTKLRGEQQVQRIFNGPGYVIVRTAWLYGKHGKNFVDAILQLARKQPFLRVVNDQTGSPTYTKDLARGIMALLEQEMTGIVHVTNDGTCTWHEFAKAILEFTGLSHIPIQPITATELGRPAPRPCYSVLDTSKFVGITGQTMPHWKQGLQAYLNELQQNALMRI